MIELMTARNNVERILDMSEQDRRRVRQRRRQALRVSYPDLFKTMLVPKAEELTAMPCRFDGSKDDAHRFFESGMLTTFRQINIYVRDDVPTTVYYAYKQSEEDGDSTTSTGWETMLSAIIQAGLAITGTWPM